MSKLPSIALPKISSIKMPRIIKTGKNLRRVPRLGIDELNKMGQEELSKHPAMRKDKSWWEYPLDFLDLPRNLVANAIGSAVGIDYSKLEREGAFGLPDVPMSAILKQLNIADGPAAAVIGFIGDVAIDPLTYLGGAGLAKIGGKSVAKAGTTKIDDAVRLALKSGKSSSFGSLKRLVPTMTDDVLKRIATKPTTLKTAEQRLPSLIKRQLSKQVSLLQARGRWQWHCTSGGRRKALGGSHYCYGISYS